MNKKVQIIDLVSQYNGMKKEIDEAVLGVLGSGRYILGENVTRFEKEIAVYLGTKHAVSCASGSDALLLALMAYGVQPGDEIITTPFTFFATAGSIARLGAKPVFVDIDPDTCNIAPSEIKEKISKKTKGIIPVHLYGQSADMDPIMKTAREHGLFVIEDACQAIGARYGKKMAGTIGGVGAFSFFPTKNLGCCGDGGLMTTDDDILSEKLFVLREHGAKDRYYHKVVGINSRLDALQAAILSVKLKRLDAWNAARRSHAVLYNELLKGCGLKLPVESGGNFHIYNQYVIGVPGRRDELKVFLAENGVSTFVYYPVALSLQECFKYLGCRKGDFPSAEKAAEEVLALPVAPELSDDDIKYVAEKVIELCS